MHAVSLVYATNIRSFSFWTRNTPVGSPFCPRIFLSHPPISHFIPSLRNFFCFCPFHLDISLDPYRLDMMAALTRTTRKRALSAHTKESLVRQSSHPTVALTTAKISSPAPRTSDPAHVRSSPWMTFQVPRSELDLSTTLKCGQSFRWQRSHRELPSGAFSQPLFSCVLNHKLWCLEETEDGFRYRTYRSTPLSCQQLSEVTDQEIQEDRAFLHDYLQLQVPLTDLYGKWSAKDPNFKAKAPLFPGVRILRQDPVENLICFICSSNNNIGRISQMASRKLGTIPTFTKCSNCIGSCG